MATPEQISTAVNGWRSGLSYVKAANLGGIPMSQLLKHVRPTQEVMAALRKRSRSRCEKCRSRGVTMEVHHKSRTDCDFNAPDNLLYLCSFCHREVETINVKSGDTCPVTAYVPLSVANSLVDGAMREGISLSRYIGNILKEACGEMTAPRKQACDA